MGTPEFMAPEQITHPDVVDARVDIYALGVIMYHMLSGKTPFGGADVAVQTLFLQVVNELPPHIERDDIPAEVLALLDKALSKDPHDRFPDMRTMGAALELLAPPPVMSGNYSGRVEALPAGAGTGSRPVLKLTTSRQVGPKSGVYVAATRTSLVEMAAAKAGGGEAAPRRRAGRWCWARSVGRRAGGGRRARRARPESQRSRAGSRSPPRPQRGARNRRGRCATGPVKLEVASSTPSARVTFRGRVHSIPFSDKRRRRFQAGDRRGHRAGPRGPPLLADDRSPDAAVGRSRAGSGHHRGDHRGGAGGARRARGRAGPGAGRGAGRRQRAAASTGTGRRSRSKVAVADAQPERDRCCRGVAKKGAPPASARLRQRAGAGAGRRREGARAGRRAAASARRDAAPPPPPAPVAVKPQPAPAKPAPAPAPVASRDARRGAGSPGRRRADDRQRRARRASSASTPSTCSAATSARRSTTRTSAAS